MEVFEVKRKLSVLLCAALCLALFSGCGSEPAAEPTAEPTVEPTAEPTEAPLALEGHSLMVFCGAGMTEPFQEIAAAFESETGCAMQVT